MSETAAAFAILPVLIALVLFLEGTRLCCTRLLNRRRTREASVKESRAMEPGDGQQLQI